MDANISTPRAIRSINASNPNADFPRVVRAVNDRVLAEGNLYDLNFQTLLDEDDDNPGRTNDGRRLGPRQQEKVTARRKTESKSDYDARKTNEPFRSEKFKEWKTGVLTICQFSESVLEQVQDLIHNEDGFASLFLAMIWKRANALFGTLTNADSDQIRFDIEHVNGPLL